MILDCLTFDNGIKKLYYSLDELVEQLENKLATLHIQVDKKLCFLTLRLCDTKYHMTIFYGLDSTILLARTSYMPNVTIQCPSVVKPKPIPEPEPKPEEKELPVFDSKPFTERLKVNDTQLRLLILIYLKYINSNNRQAGALNTSYIREKFSLSHLELKDELEKLVKMGYLESKSSISLWYNPTFHLLGQLTPFNEQIKGTGCYFYVHKY